MGECTGDAPLLAPSRGFSLGIEGSPSAALACSAWAAASRECVYPSRGMPIEVLLLLLRRRSRCRCCTTRNSLKSIWPLPG